jgi:beta-phosphoglucomutase-like phosphatase (HAD superfamily)
MIYKGYIFDLDGTVLDSMGVWHDVDVEFLGKRGLPFSEEYGKAISHMKLELAAEYTVELYGLNEKPSDIMREWLDMAEYEFKCRVGLKPYAKELLELLHVLGIPVAAATTSRRSLYRPALERNGILGYFDAFSDAEKAERGKDSPEIFLRAAEMLGKEIKDCIVFEDTPQAIKTAKKAGFTVAAVAEKGKADDSGIFGSADMVIEDFTGVFKELERESECKKIFAVN